MAFLQYRELNGRAKTGMTIMPCQCKISSIRSSCHKSVCRIIIQAVVLILIAANVVVLVAILQDLTIC